MTNIVEDNSEQVKILKIVTFKNKDYTHEEFIQKFYEQNHKQYYEVLKNYGENPEKFSENKDNFKQLGEAIAFDRILREIVEFYMNPKESELILKYRNNQSKDLQDAKNAILKNLDRLKDGFKNNERMVEFFYEIPEIANYLKQFKFNMKNKHSGKYELSIDKNVYFSPVYNSETGSPYFRFFDEVEKAVKMFDSEDSNVEKQKEIMLEKIFVPHIWHGCGYCEHNNNISFDHEKMEMVELRDEVCTFSEKDLSKMSVEIKTSGKFLITNDLRPLLEHKKCETRDKINKYAMKNNLNTSLNSFEGQEGNMKAYAAVYNLGYIQAGNHGASIYKRSDEKVDIMYYDEDNLPPDGDLSLNLWAVHVMDYKKALTFAPKKMWDELIDDYTIVDVKPGTYVVNSYNTHEDDLEVGDNVAFGDLQWKCD